MKDETMTQCMGAKGPEGVLENIPLEQIEERLKQELPKMAHHLATYLKGAKQGDSVLIDGEHERLRLAQGSPIGLSWIFTLTAPVPGAIPSAPPLKYDLELCLTLNRARDHQSVEK